MSPSSTFATQSSSIPSSSFVGESTQQTVPFGAESRRRGLQDGVPDPQVRKKFNASGVHIADSTQRTQRTPDFERRRNLEDDHQSTSRNDDDDRSPGVSPNRPGPVDKPSSSFNPLSTSSRARAAVAVPGSPAPKHDHRNESFVDTNSLDHQVRVKNLSLRGNDLISMWGRTTLVRASNSYMKTSANTEKGKTHTVSKGALGSFDSPWTI